MILNLLATNLQSNSFVNAYIDEILITNGWTDEFRRISLSLTLPDDIEIGLHVVSTNIQDTAISAYCSIYVNHPPVFDIPPTPEIGTEFYIEVGIHEYLDPIYRSGH